MATVQRPPFQFFNSSNIERGREQGSEEKEFIEDYITEAGGELQRGLPEPDREATQ